MGDRDSVHFTEKQIAFLMEKTGAKMPQEAIQILMDLMNQEGVDPIKMPTYISKMMEKDKAVSGR